MENANALSPCRRAKEKRERLRGSHLAPDYIPLGGVGGVAGLGAAGAHDTSLAAGKGQHPCPS